MKKITLFLGIVSIMATVSCKKKEDKPFPPQVETSSAATPSTPTASGQAKDSTSIKIGTDGVNISTEGRNTKTNVNVSGGEAKIEIKK